MELQGTYTGMDLLADAHTVAAPVGGTAFLLTITATAVSPEKEVFAKEETDFPRITFFKEEHPMNVESGMLINESPMVASFIFLQAKKVAPLPRYSSHYLEGLHSSNCYKKRKPYFLWK
jgi:hypothetical protein